ncbi:MAG: BrnT family toxin [Saprospiraceae bacterium]|nr:BrnT family toxin [Saprospiraceae bacterium]
MKYSWDLNKSASNKRKHGIDFDQAKEVFGDDKAIVDKGRTVREEERWIAIGKTLKLFIIAVVFTIRDTTIRIISARQARKDEIKEYIGNSLKGHSDEEDDENS